MGEYAAIALSSFSTVSNIEESQRQASAASAQGQYAKAVDYQNAKLLDYQAQDALQRGQVDAQRQGLATRQNIGTSRAALAAQGVDVSSGSAADVQASEASIGAMDEMRIRNNAASEAWGYKVEAVNQRREGDIAAVAGDAAASGYRAQSWSSLVTGALQTYGIYQRYGPQRNKQDETKTPNRTGRPSGRY